MIYVVFLLPLTFTKPHYSDLEQKGLSKLGPLSHTSQDMMNCSEPCAFCGKFSSSISVLHGNSYSSHKAPLKHHLLPEVGLSRAELLHQALNCQRPAGKGLGIANATSSRSSHSKEEDGKGCQVGSKQCLCRNNAFAHHPTLLVIIS